MVFRPKILDLLPFPRSGVPFPRLFPLFAPLLAFLIGACPVVQPTDTPTLTPTPTSTIVPTATPTPTPSPMPESTPTPVATPTPTPTLVSTPTPTPTLSPIPTATPTPVPTPTPTPTSVPTPTPRPTPLPTPTPTPRSTPVPTPTPLRTASPAATPTPSVSPTVTPAATPTPTPALAPTPTPTTVPTPTPTPTPTPGPTPTPVPQATYVSENFGFSFSYPQDWLVTVELPQRLELHNGAGQLRVTVDTQIFLVAADLEEYTGLVMQDFQDNLTDFALVSGPDPVEGPQQALEVRFTFSHEEDQQVREGRAVIAASGRLGFILTASSDQALFGQYEPAVEGMFNSLSLPDSGFVPPSPEVVYSTLATDVSPVTNEPTGVGITFETTAPRIVSYLELRYLPIDSNVLWAWAQVSTTGDLETIAVVGPLPAAGTGPVWSWIEPEGSLGVGFYVAFVFANEEVVAVSPFAIVLRHGAEFDDPQSYVDWAQFLLNYWRVRDSGIRSKPGHCIGSCPRRRL